MGAFVHRRRASMPAPALAVCLALLPALPTGCDGPHAHKKTEPATKPAGDRDKPFRAPKVPGADELAVRAETMVTTGPDQAEPTYTHDPEFPSGTLKGVCYVSVPSLAPGAAEPEPQPWGFSGSGAIHKPLPGEVEYYRNLHITTPTGWYLGGKLPAGYGVAGAVVMLRDVKVGPLAPLPRPGFTTGHGKITCQIVRGYGLTNVSFATIGEKVLFGTVDAYPCHFVVTELATGRTLFDGMADAYGKLSNPSAKDVARGGRPDPRAFRPKILQSRPINETGVCAITCRRHPWQKGYLFVVENPYVAQTGGKRRRRTGVFTIPQVPVGRHTLEVWHPEYEPVSRTAAVDVRQDEVTEVLIEFRPPERWRRKTDKVGAAK